MQKLPLWLAVAALPLAAQDKTLTCENGGGWNDQSRHCEVQEQTLPGAGRLAIDGRTNGGISVKGWDRGDMLVRSRVEAWGPTAGEARATYGQVIVHASGGQVAADGPGAGHWSVSYEVFVPKRIDLDLKAHNGGVSIRDVQGHLEFQTQNGGVHMTRVAGDVKGRTQNGGVHIELAGARWDGAGLNVETHNGGVHVELPDQYSAHIESSTVNGGFHSDFPALAKTDRRQRDVQADIGGGGPTLHVTTVNGGVHIGKKQPAHI